MSEPIAIIGVGCCFPGGANTPEVFWQLLASEQEAIGEIPPDRWDWREYYDPDPATPDKMSTRWGGFIDNIAGFDNQFFGIAPGEVLRMDPQQRRRREVAWEALENAGQSVDRLARSQTGVDITSVRDKEPPSIRYAWSYHTTRAYRRRRAHEFTRILLPCRCILSAL